MPPEVAVVHARPGTSGRSLRMLQKNPLCPPPPPRGRPDAAAHPGCAERPARTFVSAEDFDGTGILAGVDPCESRYWWLPELATAGGGDDAQGCGQATSAPRIGATADA